MAASVVGSDALELENGEKKQEDFTHGKAALDVLGATNAEQKDLNIESIDDKNKTSSLSSAAGDPLVIVSSENAKLCESPKDSAQKVDSLNLTVQNEELPENAAQKSDSLNPTEQNVTGKTEFGVNSDDKHLSDCKSNECHTESTQENLSALKTAEIIQSTINVTPDCDDDNITNEKKEKKIEPDLKCVPEDSSLKSSENNVDQVTTAPASKEETSHADDDVFEDGCIYTSNATVKQENPDPVKSVSFSSDGRPEKSISLSSEGKSEDGFKEERPVREMLVRKKRSESTNSNSDKPVLETLTFSATMVNKTKKEDEIKAEEESGVLVCLLCDRSYPADSKEDVRAHLVLMHKFVIADIYFIANLAAYLRYWKKRLEEKPVSEFCSKIVTNTGTKDQAPKEEFYLLCDALPEDKDLREHLQRKKLESVLAQQQKEREETKFCRQCLFCKQTYCGNRAVLFDHLLRDHTFHMGQPDNLVFTDELFDLIQCKLDNQLCLFCEKSFKDKASLREHMRKKQHRKINPKNKEYDRFYIINYMEMGKNWESLQSEDNRLVKTSEKGSDEEEEWGGWEEEAEPRVVCLFCDSSCTVQADLQNHMKEKHSFDLQEVNHKLQLNFYQKVKLINYIRRQVYHKTCYGCQETFCEKEALLSHLAEFSDHVKKVPDPTVWDQPQYFFPTYEDDSLLCHLDDDDDGASGDALGVTVIPEDIPIKDTILKDQKIYRDLKP